MELPFEDVSLEARLEEIFRQSPSTAEQSDGMGVIRMLEKEIANLFQIVQKVFLSAYAGKQILLEQMSD